MALLTPVEQQQMKSRGLWIREKCDREGCGRPINYIRWNGKTGRVYCSDACHDACERAEPIKRKPKEKLAGTPESLESAILTRIEKEPKEKWTLSLLKDLLAKQGVGMRQEIRQSILNLLSAGRLIQEGRRLLIGKSTENGAMVHSTGKQKRTPQDRAVGVRTASQKRSKTVEIEDVPVWDR